MRFPISDQFNSNSDFIFYRLVTIARTDLQGRPRSIIFILLERAYATFY